MPGRNPDAKLLFWVGEGRLALGSHQYRCVSTSLGLRVSCKMELGLFTFREFMLLWSEHHCTPTATTAVLKTPNANRDVSGEDHPHHPGEQRTSAIPRVFCTGDPLNRGTQAAEKKR